MEGWRVGTIFEKNIKAKTRYVLNEGGTRSSKTMSILQVLHKIMEVNPNKHLIISVVSETMPHLRKGAMTDYFDRLLKPYGLYDEKKHNKTDSSYEVNGNKIEFFSADSADKIHGPGRHILFCNELQNFNYDTYFHLCQRTDLRIYADWNPTHDFFIYDKYLYNHDYDSDITLIHSTLLDNPFLSEAIKTDVLRRAKNDDNYRKVYLEGVIGSREGIIFPDFDIVDSFPTDGIISAGLDFGFTNDPTAIILYTKQNNRIYLHEACYQTGLVNSEIVTIMRTLPINDITVADSSEPKSITELSRYGIRIIGAVKGPDSVNNGIDRMKQVRFCVTKESVNLIKELRNYSWLMNKDGKLMNVPAPGDDHAIDAVRYIHTHKSTNNFNKPRFNVGEN